MELLYFFEKLRNPVADAFFSAITLLGSETLFLVIAIAVFWCVSKKTGYYLLTVGFFGIVINQLLKLVCRVPRPWVKDPDFTIVESARADATGYSFPSGHTQSVTASLGCPARASKNKLFRAAAILLILLTAVSRMYLGVHTLADVAVSLIIGSALVFLLYPLFERIDKKPIYMYALLSAMAAVSLAFALFAHFAPHPADIDKENLYSAVKNGYLLFGCSLGLILSFYIEKRFVKFDTAAPWWVQILKTAIGLLLVLALKAGLKPILNFIFGERIFTTAVRYFIIVVFAVCVWPMTFKWFSGLKRANR